jgi:hypothetical protein
MEKVLKITTLKDQGNDYAFWLIKTEKERIKAIEFLRSNYIKFKKMFSEDFKDFVEVLQKNNAAYFSGAVLLP